MPYRDFASVYKYTNYAECRKQNKKVVVTSKKDNKLDIYLLDARICIFSTTV